MLQEGPAKNDLVLSTKYQIQIRYLDEMMVQIVEIEFKKIK